MRSVRGMLKGENKYETAENYSIALLIFGSVILAAGIGLNAISTVGVPTILAMLGAMITFLATVALIITWFLKEVFGD